MITESLSTLNIHKLTQEQYDRELEAGRIDENALYLTPDEDNIEFIVTITGNDSDGYTADKTYDEVIKAHKSGRPVVAEAAENEYGKIRLPLIYMSELPDSEMLLFAYDKGKVFLKPDNSVEIDDGSGQYITIGNTIYNTLEGQNLTVPIQEVARGVAEEVSSNKISIPDTVASVGQVIAVKVVDENGKPTEWETIDLNAKIQSIVENYVNEAILGGAW